MNKFIHKFGREHFLIVVLLIASYWFRIQGFIYSTFAFTYDVGRDMLALLAMEQTHKPLLIGATTGMHGVFYGPTWYYLLFPFFLIFKGNPSAIALIMATSGFLTALCGYFLGKKVGGNVIGVTMLALIGVSQVLTEISTQIWNPNFIPLFIVVFLLIAVSEKLKIKRFSWIAMGLILGIIFDLEIVFGTLFLISALIYLSVFEKKFRSFKSVVLLGVGFLVVQLPRVLFELRHDFLMTRTLLNSLEGGDSSGILTPSPRLVKTFVAILSVWTNTVAWQVSALGIILLVVSVVILSLSYKKLEAGQKKFFRFLVITPCVYFVGLSFFNHDIESHYYIGLPLIFILLVSFVIGVFYLYLKKSVIMLAIAIVLVASCVNQLKILNTFQKSEWIGDASVYRNQVQIVDYIYKEAGSKKFNYLVYTPPIYDYPYQYLFKWYGAKQYKYTPDIKAQSLLFVVIEPDNIPGRQEAWLEIRKEDGKIVKEKTFQSGIKVQTRLR